MTAFADFDANQSDREGGGGRPRVAAEIRVDRVVKAFGGALALDGCSLDIPAGRVTGLIGPNGAGKTTLLNVIAGLIKPDSGTVSLDGRDITGLASHRIAALGVVRTFQIVRELSSLTVLENLLLAPAGQCGETVSGALFRRAEARAQERRNMERARDLLDRVGLWRLRDAPAGGLSGGQKKLLELARALMLEPTIILLDEPAAGVAPPLLTEMIRIVRALVEEGITFAIVEHDMHLIEAVCDRVHVLAMGSTLVSGTFREVTADRRVVEAYLGLAA